MLRGTIAAIRLRTILHMVAPFLCTLLYLVLPLRLDGQVVDQANSAQASATVSLDHGTVKAGDIFHFTIDISAPLPKDANIQVGFHSTDDEFTAVAQADGTQLATFTVTVPKDLPGGNYVASAILYYNGRRYVSINFNTSITVTVIPAPNPIVLPSKASAKLDLDQRQYIRVQAEPLEKIRESLIQHLDKDAADSAALRANLITATENAEALLPSVRAQYLSLYKIKPLLTPVLFDDFQVRYQHLLIELKAPGWPQPSALPTVSLDRYPRVLTVQLQRRPAVPEQDDSQPEHTMHAGYPPFAESVLNLLYLNIRAYQKLADSGVDGFSITLTSHPVGATIYYTRVGEQYQQLSARTNVPQTTFPYAMWTFKFVLAGCRTYIEEANPYIESHPAIDAELICKNR